MTRTLSTLAFDTQKEYRRAVAFITNSSWLSKLRVFKHFSQQAVFKHEEDAQEFEHAFTIHEKGIK